ncbi:MAG: type VII toxin-antitoxin system HepT family RNase toxin [Dictyoglomaceae bacterium]
MLQFNPDKISKLISEIRKTLNRLKNLQSLTEEEFLSDPNKIDSAKYNFIVAIESVIDICNHLISKNALRSPKDYGDTFQVLEEHGILEEEFVADLKNMVKFRNRLVHLYWEVDDRQIYKILQENLDTFTNFLNKLADVLDLGG